MPNEKKEETIYNQSKRYELSYDICQNEIIKYQYFVLQHYRCLKVIKHIAGKKARYGFISRKNRIYIFQDNRFLSEDSGRPYPLGISLFPIKLVYEGSSISRM